LRAYFKKEGIEGAINKYVALIEPSITTRLKIALVGEGGVGKTTTLHLLLGDTPPLQYVPTIALNLETVENIRFGNYSLVLWDFAGQERFRTLWRFYFHGADVIFLVCDSTLRNVIISKDILKLIKRDAPKVPVFAMANKQDKPNAMKPEVVQKILGIPTYPMVAIDKHRRDEMLRILMTAASQYVGVALPDLPASELLKFTDVATEEAIASIGEGAAEVEETAIIYEQEEVEEEEFETVEVVEEVFVDEEGHVIEDLDEYEIIEEEEEEVLGEVVEAAAEIPEVEAPTDSLEEFEIPTAESIGAQGDVGIQIEADFIPAPEITLEPEEEVSVETEDAEEVTASIEPELSPIVSEPKLVDLSIEDYVPELAVEKNTDAIKMAKDIIFEALEADDFDEIIATEIDQASHEELDTALQAIGSDETIPINDEPIAAGDIDAESLEELETILGPLDRSVGGTGIASKDVDKEEEDSTLPLNGDTLAELERLLDASDDEEKKD
ncbi:MAG: ADP-ribosylation factor-like protein, partial [Candidatus Thorarchaeota archaeon]